VLLLFVVAAAAGCAYQPPPDAVDPRGFFMGHVHGFFILF
jgi:hypothetical protein